MPTCWRTAPLYSSGAQLIQVSGWHIDIIRNEWWCCISCWWSNQSSCTQVSGLPSYVFGTFQKTNISLGVVSRGVITAISHVLFEIPRKSQFTFIAHMTTQTSVVCCDAKYLTNTHKAKGKIHKINWKLTQPVFHFQILTGIYYNCCPHRSIKLSSSYNLMI